MAHAVGVLHQVAVDRSHQWFAPESYPVVLRCGVAVRHIHTKLTFESYRLAGFQRTTDSPSFY